MKFKSRKNWGGGTPYKKKNAQTRLKRLAYDMGRIESASDGSVISDAYNRGANSLNRSKNKKSFF